MESQGTNRGIPFGILGSYAVDGDDDWCFGLYIQLKEHTVFVDLKEDKFLELRKVKAQELFANQEQLEESLGAFLQANPSFRDRQVAYIGLHSKNLAQGEVFWDPNGYTLLKGLSFELE